MKLKTIYLESGQKAHCQVLRFISPFSVCKQSSADTWYLAKTIFKADLQLRTPYQELYLTLVLPSQSSPHFLMVRQAFYFITYFSFNVIYLIWLAWCPPGLVWTQSLLLLLRCLLGNGHSFRFVIWHLVSGWLSVSVYISLVQKVIKNNKRQRTTAGIPLQSLCVFSALTQLPFSPNNGQGHQRLCKPQFSDLIYFPYLTCIGFINN